MLLVCEMADTLIPIGRGIMLSLKNTLDQGCSIQTIEKVAHSKIIRMCFQSSTIEQRA